MKVIHIDMDQFFAAVEQRDNPELKGKPIAVGHDAERGVVATASYEARRFGVHSAQSIQVAKRLCPQLIIVEPHFQRYKEVSAQLHEIFHDYTDLIEPISLDEAFLDVTENKKGIELGVEDCLRLAQARRPDGDSPKQGLGLHRPTEGGENLGSRPKDGRKDAPNGHFYRTGSEEHVTYPADAGVRQDGPGVL